MALRPEGISERMSEAVHNTLDHLRGAAATRGVSCAALALAWMILHPQCTAPIVGPSRSALHLGHVAEALGVELTADEQGLFTKWFESASA